MFGNNNITPTQLWKLLAFSPPKGILEPEAYEQYKFRSYITRLSFEEKLKASWTAISNEFDGRRNPVFGLKLKALGKISGAPDMVFWTNNGGLGLEFKSKGGKLSENQKLYKAWADDVEAPYKVVYCVEQAIDILHEFNLIKD